MEKIFSKNLELSKRQFLEKSFVFALSVAVFGLSGAIAIPLWFSPAPIVLQVQVAILFGALFGSRKALSILLSSYALALFNVPMFSGGSTGIAKFMGPTAGYLAGYFLGALLLGQICRYVKMKNSIMFFAYFCLSTLAVYIVGLPVLGLFVGFDKVLALGFYPFLPGMLIKCAVLSQTFFPLVKKKWGQEKSHVA